MNAVLIECRRTSVGRYVVRCGKSTCRYTRDFTIGGLGGDGGAEQLRSHILDYASRKGLLVRSFAWAADGVTYVGTCEQK